MAPYYFTVCWGFGMKSWPVMDCQELQVVQQFSVRSAQGFVEHDQLIYQHACVVSVIINVASSYNNLTISSWILSFILGYFTCHFLSIVEHSDPFSIIGSDVVHHNVGPASWYGEVCRESSIQKIHNETETQ